MVYRLMLLIILSISQCAYAAHWVRSYVRSNGTFVTAHISGDPGEGAYGHWHHNVYYPNTYASTTHNNIIDDIMLTSKRRGNGFCVVDCIEHMLKLMICAAEKVKC